MLWKNYKILYNFFFLTIINRHYSDILSVLSNAIFKESHAGARDNIVGALARLIIANYFNVPLDQVFPTFVKQLPLKEDFEENKAVFKSILTLYEAGHPILRSHIEILLKVAVSVLHENKTTDDGILYNSFIIIYIIKHYKIIIYNSCLIIWSLSFIQRQKVLLWNSLNLLSEIFQMNGILCIPNFQ